MTNIKEHILRAKTAMEKMPSIGQGDQSSTTTLKQDLLCVTEEGPWIIKCDMPEILGGGDTAPDGSAILRAALGTCLTTSYAMWAAQLDIPVKNIQVTVTVTYDDGSALGVNDKPPGFSKVIYRVSIDSESSDNDIIHLLDIADRHSPILDVFTRELDCIREVDMGST